MSKIAGIHTQSPTQTKLTSGSGTYTIPTGVKYLRVRMVGGGVGQGGGAGGYIDAIIYAPASTYSYTVAAATTGSGGGNGAAGVIVIDEFYV